MKYLLLVLSLLTADFISAQILGDNTNYGVDMLLTKPSKVDLEIEGSPFLEKQFLPALLTGYKETFNLRYNAYNDEMEFLKTGDVFYLNKNEGVIINFNNGKKYICLDYALDNVQYYGFLVLLSDINKEYILLKRESISISDGVTNINSYQEGKLPSYQKNKDVYIIKSEGKYFKFPKNIKDINFLASDEKNKLQNFMKVNKLSTSKESDMITIIDFLAK